MRKEKTGNIKKTDKRDLPIHVLCVFSTLDRGGAESMCMSLYRHMDRSKVQFDFVKHEVQKGHFEEEIEQLGGRIYTAPRLKPSSILSYIRWWSSHLERHPEHRIIHGHFFTISAIYLCIAKRFKRVTIGHIHSSKPVQMRKSDYAKAVLLKFVERYADYCFACSESAGKWIYPHRKFKVINNAVDAEKFRNNPEKRKKARALLGIDQDALVVGTVGNFSAVKNPMATIAIFDEVLKIVPTAKFLWIGDGYLREQIVTEIVKRHLSERIILAGTRSDVDCMLQAMDAFILPSLYEGLPVVAIEAQAAGLRCFFSDTVTREADITCRCTYLNNADYIRWAEEICSANLTKTDTYDQICEAGYDVHKSAEWLQNFYRKVSKGRV